MNKMSQKTGVHVTYLIDHDVIAICSMVSEIRFDKVYSYDTRIQLIFSCEVI